MIRGFKAIRIKGVTDAADSQAASSNWVDVRGLDGYFTLIVAAGELGSGTVISFAGWTARDANGTGAKELKSLAPIAPATSAESPVTAAVIYDATQLLGFLQVRAVLQGPKACVCYTVVALPKYA